ncbi:hypothetical protein MTO96_044415, partial [Rhipicephalus appendiculatus]
MAQEQALAEKHQRDSHRESCTQDQWAAMLDFLCVHTGLGRATNEMQPETRQRLWSELTSLLNALGPVSRSREEWRKPPSGTEEKALPVGLSEEDARVLSVVGDEVALEVVEGHGVQKRRERPSPSSASSLSAQQPSKSEHGGSPSQRGRHPGEISGLEANSIAYSAVSQDSTGTTEGATSRKHRSHSYIARIAEAQERLA